MDPYNSSRALQERKCESLTYREKKNMVLGWAAGWTVSDQGTIWATSIHVACHRLIKLERANPLLVIHKCVPN